MLFRCIYRFARHVTSQTTSSNSLNVEDWVCFRVSLCGICGWFWNGVFCVVSSTVELQLSVLTGKTSYPDMQNKRIIGFFLDNRQHWQFEVKKIPTDSCYGLQINLRTNKNTYLLTYLLTHSMEQSPSWEAKRLAASQEIPRILWNPKVQKTETLLHNSLYVFGNWEKFRPQKDAVQL